MKKLAAILAVTALLAPSISSAGWNADWPQQRQITIDTSDSGVEIREGLSQMPLALRLHTGNFGFADARPDGADLRFIAADDKTPLKHHVEKFDAANELAVVWVQAPKLAAGKADERIFLYYGNPKAQPADDAQGVYDPAQVLVLHFGEAEAPKDATQHANHPRESTARLGAVGPLGAAASFDGTALIALPAAPSLKLAAASGFTFTAWVKPADAQDGELFRLGAAGKGVAIGIAGGRLTATLHGKEFHAEPPLQPGAWQHVAVSVGAGKLAFFVNGRAAGAADAALADAEGEVTIGQRYRGDLDEVTLAATARSADYLKVLHGAQEPDGFLMEISEGEEEESGESASYFGILLGAVTVDGWVIIGILIVMGFISVVVMIAKTQFLVRTRKGNNAFFERFKKQSRELLTPGTPAAAAMADDPHVAGSSVYRIYEIGLREVQQRFEAMAQLNQPAILSAASLDAIRASMDGGLVRENHRLNSQIVLLTIAISGGPFLGLLGTVVGVMITFAAIAAAGDVNVNSIAPGIAAALVATVAGLAVAIPALFGYNWLASQIKNISADMQVFADEFLTKAAELHSR